jgi:hypothetical protein
LLFVFAFRIAFHICSCFQLNSSVISTKLFNNKRTLSFRPERSAVEKSAFQPGPPTPHPKSSTRASGFVAVFIVFIALAMGPTSAHPQGCTQCLENTAATPPATQRAYRRAIILLTLTAGGLFVTTITLLKRHR